MRILACWLLGIYSLLLLAQAPTPNSRLKIMIVPYVKSDGDIKQTIDTSALYRIAVHQLMGEIADFHYTPVDYLEWLAKIRRTNIISQLSPDSILQEIRHAPADVFIRVELFLEEFPGRQRQLRMLLSANDKYSAERYATSDLMESQRRVCPDFTYVLRNLFTLEDDKNKGEGREGINAFFKKLDARLQRVLQEGRTVELQIKKDSRSKVRFDEDIRGKIKEFVKNRAIDHYIFQSGGNDQLMILEFKTPIVDIAPADIGEALIDYMKKNLFSLTANITSQYVGAQININIQ